MSQFKLWLIGAFALVLVLGSTPAFAQGADADADSDTVELDVSGIVSDLAESMNTDIELKEQYSVGNVTADLDLTISGGTDVSATAAAIANSATIESVTGVALYSDQQSVGDTMADVLVDISDSTGDVSVTSAAMGNSLSATSDSGLNYSLILQSQASADSTDVDPAGIVAGVSGPGESGLGIIENIGQDVSVTAAGLGNSASLSALELDTVLDQGNASTVEAFVATDIIEAGTSAAITAAAIGNSATADSGTGTDVELTQVNTGELVSATIETLVDTVGHNTGDALGDGVSLTAAAIANSGTVSALDYVDLLSVQSSDADVESFADASVLSVVGDVSVTAASIANSLSATSENEDGFIDVNQLNSGFTVDAEIVNSMDSINGDATATAAAISNSATVDVATQLDLYSDQTSSADVAAVYSGDVFDVTGSVSLTAAGIANSLTATSEQNDGIVTATQTNDGWNVVASVDEATSTVFGALDATAAAIGNSATFSSDRLDLISTQTNDADPIATIVLDAVLVGGDVSATGASIGNSLSATATGEGDFNANQSNNGTIVGADVTGTLDGLLGDVSITGAALGNSLTQESVGFLDSEIEQNNMANITSSVTAMIGMGDGSSIGEMVSATSASIANSASITVK
ncbi:MAG: hypothetical protein HRU00_15315 [Myxococcales bacterium]|nr:hypothetical protein [Myxococcales bacterium]